MARSLRGRNIVLTRAPDDARAWARTLTALGARPVIFPCLTVSPIADDDTKTALRRAVDNADWLLLFSRRGVHYAADLLEHTVPPRLRVGVVGPSSADAARERFGRVSLVPAITTAAGLADELASIAASGTAQPPHVVLAGAASGQDEAEAVLRAAGIRVSSIPIYRTLPAPTEVPRHEFSSHGQTDILVASPSAVVGLMNRARVPRTARVITIGPTTTAAARAAGLHVAAEARRPGLAGLLEVL